MLELSYEQYRCVYFVQILARLDPAKVMGDLDRLAEGHEPVFVCFERPPLTPTNWCHRTMVAEWFHETLGCDVQEIDAVR